VGPHLLPARGDPLPGRPHPAGCLPAGLTRLLAGGSERGLHHVVDDAVLAPLGDRWHLPHRNRRAPARGDPDAGHLGGHAAVLPWRDAAETYRRADGRLRRAGGAEGLTPGVASASRRERHRQLPDSPGRTWMFDDLVRIAYPDVLHGVEHLFEGNLHLGPGHVDTDTAV